MDRIFYSNLGSLQSGEFQQYEINNETKSKFVKQTITVMLITVGAEVLDAKLLVYLFNSTILLDYFSTYVAKLIELIIYFQIDQKLYLLLKYSESINYNLRTSFISHKIIKPKVVETYIQNHAVLYDLMNEIGNIHRWQIQYLWRCTITRFLNSLSQIIIVSNSLHGTLFKIFVLVKLSYCLLYCVSSALEE